MLDSLKGVDGRGLLAGLAATAVLSAGIVLGSGTLRHYDPILLTYTFGTLFCAFAVAYRYAVWLQRPPTKVYWRRGWSLLFRRGRVLRNLAFMIRSAAANLLAQRFIRRRSWLRWFVHFCIAWGCVIAAAVTFPLVFGWLRFESRPDVPEIYRVIFLGAVLGEFHTGSWVRFVAFNLLNLSAVMVTVGAGLSLRRRLKDGAAIGRQQFGNDIVPLLLLLGISVTGLMLTFSTHALGGAGYPVLSLVHALVVCATLLYLPFGKLFHIFQRPAQMGVILYRRENARGPQALCRTCGGAFAGALHVGDLRQVMTETGFRWEGRDGRPSLMEICPRCRRRSLALAHSALRRDPVSDFKEIHGEAAVGRS